MESSTVVVESLGRLRTARVAQYRRMPRFKRLALLCLLACAGCPAKRRPEPARQLIKLGKLAKVHYEDTSSFVVGTAVQAPTKGRTGCCYGGGGGGNHCRADPVAFASDPVWQRLDFMIEEDSLFYYDYTGTKTSFIARATGDLDCDGTEIVYTLLGSAVDGNPHATLIEPPVDAD